MRLVFLGTSDFAVPALAALVEAGHDVAGVYTQPPRPAGRGQVKRLSPIHIAANAYNLDVRTPASLRQPEARRAFASLAADAAVVAAYGLILPPPILAAPRLGCLNIHGSLLPRWRGAAPIQRAILAGDDETGVTIMQMDEGLDTGSILAAERVPITGETTAARLHDELAAPGARLIVAALDGLERGAIAARLQAIQGVTYAPKLRREEGCLDWRQPAELLERQVRALTPWPGAYFDKAGARIKVLAAEIRPGRGAAGTVLDDALTIACGAGALGLTTLQRQGKRAHDAASFQRGFALPAGSVLATEAAQ